MYVVGIKKLNFFNLKCFPVALISVKTSLKFNSSSRYITFISFSYNLRKLKVSPVHEDLTI